MITERAFFMMNAASSALPGLDGLVASVGQRRPRLAEAAEDHADERAVHRPAHDVGQDRARGADQGAGDDQRGFCSAKPMPAAAQPEYELSIEITTGMSAPPIGTIRRKPIANASSVISQNTNALPVAMNTTSRSRIAAPSPALIR